MIAAVLFPPVCLDFKTRRGETLNWNGSTVQRRRIDLTLTAPAANPDNRLAQVKRKRRRLNCRGLTRPVTVCVSRGKKMKQRVKQQCRWQEDDLFCCCVVETVLSDASSTSPASVCSFKRAHVYKREATHVAFFYRKQDTFFVQSDGDVGHLCGFIPFQWLSAVEIHLLHLL